MEKQPIVAVFDKKTGLFDNPVATRHVAEALREWQVVSKNKDTKYGKNPEDFDLIHIGYYDISTAKFENLTPHYNLAQGIQ